LKFSSEITPRTQNAIYRDKIRIQELTAFFRQADLEYASTGHPARRIRVTGYLLWDDEHNGAADVGTTIRTVAANKYHNPWRSAAWEIHPAIKIERLDSAPATAPTPAAPAQPSSPPAVNTTPSPKPISSVPTPTSQQFATLLQPVKIKIPYGETVLPRGTRLPIVSRQGQTVVIQYMDGSYAIPISSTDLQ
jgi:hypothetical protein